MAKNILRKDEGWPKNRWKVTSEVPVRPWISRSCARSRTIPESLFDTELNGLQSGAVVSLEVVDGTRAQSKSWRNFNFERIWAGKAGFRPPLFIEDSYPGRISLPSWVKRCIKFFRKARFFFSTHPHHWGRVRENRNFFSQARHLVWMQLIRVSNADSKLPWESNLACSKDELWRHLDRPIWWTIESP